VAGQTRLRLGAPVGAAEIAAAAAIGGLFAIYLGIMAIAAPPTAAQRIAADPILDILGIDASILAVALAGIAAPAVWLLIARPKAAALRVAAGQALAGCAVAGLMLLALRGAYGPSLPDFIPSEESAAPGYTLSMAAGYGEEVLFRLVLVPLLYLGALRRAPRPLAIAATALLTGLAFALLHEAGGGASSAAYFVTRTLIPGAAMTAAFLVLGPGFVIGAHGAAHLFIPLLF